MTIQEALTNIHNVLMTVPMTIPQGKIVLESFQLIANCCKSNIEDNKDANTKT